MTTQYIYDLVDTWNNGATTFTAIKMDVTDTASNAASLLMDLQVGSVSAFNVSKGGSLKLGLNTSGTNVAASNVTISGSQGTGNAAGGSIIFQVAPLGGSGSAQNGLVTFLEATSSRLFNVYGAFTDASNYERLSFTSSGGNVDISTEKAGTGVVRPIRLFTTGSAALQFGTVNVLRWNIDTSGHFVANADNTYDIGASGATRPRNVFIGGSIVVGDGGRISRQSAFGGIVFQSSNSVELGPGTGGTFATGATSAIRIVQPLTVATLPTPSTGMMARVTDALAPTMGTTVAGGGAAQALVWYNGANWTVIGV